MIINKKQRKSKTELAKKLGVSRSSLYYKAKRDSLDEEMKKYGIKPYIDITR